MAEKKPPNEEAGGMTGSSCTGSVMTPYEGLPVPL